MFFENFRVQGLSLGQSEVFWKFDGLQILGFKNFYAVEFGFRNLGSQKLGFENSKV